jgi:hypothetical protein
MKKHSKQETSTTQPQVKFLLQEGAKSTSQAGTPALTLLQEKAKSLVRSYQYGGYNGL